MVTGADWFFIRVNFFDMGNNGIFRIKLCLTKEAFIGEVFTRSGVVDHVSLESELFVASWTRIEFG